MRENLKRKGDSHKGDYGHVLILAGSRGMSGAAILTAQAAIRCGAGKVTLGVPKSIHLIIAKRVTEVMTLPLPETSAGSLGAQALRVLKPFMSRVNAVAIGPGLTTNHSTRKLVVSLLLNLPSLVLDADGLNNLKGRVSLLKIRRNPTILTPHEGELKRLIGAKGKWSQEKRKSIAKSFSNEYHCVLVLKGHHTVVSMPRHNAYVNRTGNAGMASGGTGDVLTGMTVAFLAQGFDPFVAACLAVYVHGAAGDKAARLKGQTALVATDIVNQIPFVLKRLEKIENLRNFLKLN